ncbi:uncharacterized protein [Amphiura filiformis]|uniref:uncharacterized protein n=1 Tax=Amphiura filiformis TaxID=82378 RepID=UPI003B221F08
MKLREIRKVFYCVVVTTLVASLLYIFTVSSRASNSVNNRGKRKHIVVESQHGKSHQKTSSWGNASIAKEYTHSNVDAENALAINIRGVKQDAMHHENSEIKGFPEIFPANKVIDILHNKSVIQAIKNHNERVKQNLTQTQLDQFVILTTVNFEFHKLFDNWFRSVKNLGLVYNIMLICEDDEAFKFYSVRQNDHFKVLNTLDYQTRGKFERKQNTYQQLITRRTIYVRNVLLSVGIDVLLVDIDAVWLKDPLEIMRQSYSMYDMWVAEGHKEGVPCPCFLYMKSVPFIMKLADRWVQQLASFSSQKFRHFDQLALQQVIKWRPDLRLFRLDKVRFPTGNEFLILIGMRSIWNMYILLAEII